MTFNEQIHFSQVFGPITNTNRQHRKKSSANRTLDIFIFAAGFGCLRVQELSTDKLLALDDCVSKGQSGAGRGRVGAHSLNSKLVLDLFHVLRAADASRVDKRCVVR